MDLKGTADGDEDNRPLRGAASSGEDAGRALRGAGGPAGLDLQGTHEEV